MSKRRSLSELLGDAKPARPAGNSRGPLPGSGAGGRPANPYRDELYREQARIARLKADKLAGSLVPVADVERQWATAVIDCRQRLLAIPSRIGSKHGLTRKQTAAIESELREALEALAASGGVAHAGKP
ncbi:MAG: hypothetical protein BroJett013_11940 [Alphaproteobacteria bacterium]|nr:MAG: hypothetical protein BroJett013_11940 [Alphaproteobacteria bacterium]